VLFVCSSTFRDFENVAPAGHDSAMAEVVHRCLPAIRYSREGSSLFRSNPMG
jgi:hypothetical protein